MLKAEIAQKEAEKKAHKAVILQNRAARAVK
jgi:hypothetical protein